MGFCNRGGSYEAHHRRQQQQNLENWVSPSPVALHGHVDLASLEALKEKTALRGGSSRKWNFALEYVDMVVRRVGLVSCPLYLCGENLQIGVDGTESLAHRPELVWTSRFRES